MVPEVPNSVPSDVCLKCDGCCRFAVADSPWRPKVAQEESGGVLAGALGADGALKTVDGAGQPQCTFFCGDDNTCRVYDQRPFECRLYPFLLLKSGDGMALGAHLSCPYVQESFDSAVFEGLVGEMRNFFARDNVRAFLRANPSLAAAYPGAEQEIDIVFTIP